LISGVPDGSRDRGAHGARGVAAVVVGLAFASIAAGGCGGGGDEGSTPNGTTSSAGAPTTTSSQRTATSSSTTSSQTTTEQVAQAHTTIRQAVEAVLVSADPTKACGSSYVTAHYLQAAYGGRQGCVQAQSSKSAASSVHFDDVTMRAILGGGHSRREASAKVAPDGGLYGGDKITVSLVREDGDWKVDALKSNAPVGP
jgi:hypothetical protein